VSPPDFLVGIVNLFQDKTTFKVGYNDGGMASKGLRAIPCQVTRKDEAGYNPSHTSETLIGYTACVRPARAGAHTCCKL
jgi:hypothetical protein